MKILVLYAHAGQQRLLGHDTVVFQFLLMLPPYTKFSNPSQPGIKHLRQPQII